MVDPVNPKHYLSKVAPYIESIDSIRAALGTGPFESYCRGNALKYIWRAGDKGNFIEDIEKPRPLTHDLVGNILEGFGAVVERMIC